MNKETNQENTIDTQASTGVNGQGETAKSHEASNAPFDSPEEETIAEDALSSSGLNTHEPAYHHTSEPFVDNGMKAQGRRRSWPGILALIIAIVALIIALQERFSSRYDVLDAINQMITETVVPGMKKTTERDVIGHIYDLKRVMVTLEEIKETSENEDVKSMVEKLHKEIEELNEKLFVHE